MGTGYSFWQAVLDWMTVAGVIFLILLFLPYEYFRRENKPRKRRDRPKYSVQRAA